MTKQEEITALKKFVEKLPKDSYLSEFFSEELGEIERIILDDFAYEPVRALQNMQRVRAELTSEIEELVKAKKKATEELWNVQASLRVVKERVEDTKERLHTASVTLERLTARI